MMKSASRIIVLYLLILAVQIPVFFFAGMFWGMSMMAFAGWRPMQAAVGGTKWAIFMCLVCGNFTAFILVLFLVWRRSVEFPNVSRSVFRVALETACRKLRMIVLAESADEVILGPKWAIVRFPQQETRITFVDEIAIVNAPAISFGAIKKRSVAHSKIR